MSLYAGPGIATGPGLAHPASTSTSSTTNSRIVCPVVTKYAPDAYIGVSTDASENVTVTGIVAEFNIDISGDARAFLDAFDLSGLRYDEVLGQVDEDISQLNLTMDDGMKTYIARAITSATDASGNVLKTWLNKQLRYAFLTAFPDMLPTTDVSDGETGPGAVVPGQTAGTAYYYATGGDAQDTTAATTLATIIRQTLLDKFSVDVDVSGGKAADKFNEAFNDASGVVRGSLYRQIAKDSWLSYYTMGSPGMGISGVEGDLNPGLPLRQGDTITFVFDVDVNATSDSNKAGVYSGVQSGVPAPSDTGPLAGVASTISLNLGNRRVAFNFNIAGAGKTGDIVPLLI